MKTSKSFRILAPVLAVAFLLLSSDIRADLNAPISAQDLQKHIKEVIAKSGPAVVGLTPKRAGGAGSGVIISEDGLILTAAHVVHAGGDEMTVWLSDGRQATAKKLGMHTGRDAAMMQIVDEGKWPHAEVAKGNADRGAWVVAMGHPGGFQPERTPPVRIGRVLNELSENSRRGFVVSDCAVSGGDSGGPLFDLEGRVVGIHSSIGMSIEQNRHVPISAFNDDWKRMEDGEVWGGGQFAGGRQRQGAVLGVQLSSLDNGGKGALVEGVVNGSPAMKAGIRAGDVIVKFSGSDIDDPTALVDEVSKKKVGDKVKVVVVRGEEEKEFEVKLADAAKLSTPNRPQFRQIDEPVFPEDLDGLLDGSGMDPEKMKRLLEMARKNGGHLELRMGPEEMKGFFAPPGFGGLGVANKPSLGVRIANPEDGTEGAEVVEVVEGSLADKAGVKAGDVIVSFGGGEVGDAQSLVEAVRGHAGGNAGIKVLRDGKEVELKAEFPAKPKAERFKFEGPQGAKGFFFDGEKMREMDPEELRKMLSRGEIPGLPGAGRMMAAQRPRLGVEIEDGDKAVVAGVEEGSPAEKAGIKAGDEIIEFAGRDIADFDSLAEAVQAQAKGGKIKARVKRDGKVETLTVEFPQVKRFEFRMGEVGPGAVPAKPKPEEKVEPKETKPAGKAQLGLMIDPTDESGDGVLVGGVADGSAAAKSGIKEGDRILAFGGKELGSFDDLSAAVGEKKPGDKVKVKILRDGKKRDLDVTLGRAEGQAAAPVPPGSGGQQMSREKMREMMERMRRGEITPEDLRKMFGGNLPFGPNSNVDPKFKRANPETIKGFEPAVSKVKNSVVVVRSNNKRVAMGTVISDGKVLTKASQIKGKEDLKIQKPNGKFTNAKPIKVMEKHDLAVLELEDASGLSAVTFADSNKVASVGTLITSPNRTGEPAGFGVVSVAARSLSADNKGFLGIRIEGAVEKGVVIGEAFDGGAARKAGLRGGDIIVSAGGTDVRSPVDLIRKVSGMKPGQEVEINFLRDDMASKAKVKLRSRADLSEAEQERMSRPLPGRCRSRGAGPAAPGGIRRADPGHAVFAPRCSAPTGPVLPPGKPRAAVPSRIPAGVSRPARPRDLRAGRVSNRYAHRSAGPFRAAVHRRGSCVDRRNRDRTRPAARDRSSGADHRSLCPCVA